MHNDESNNKIRHNMVCTLRINDDKMHRAILYRVFTGLWKSSSIHIFSPLSRLISLTLTRCHSIVQFVEFMPFRHLILLHEISYACGSHVTRYVFFCLSSVVIDTYFLLTVCMYNDIAHIHNPIERARVSLNEI